MNYFRLLFFVVLLKFGVTISQNDHGKTLKEIGFVRNKRALNNGNRKIVIVSILDEPFVMQRKERNLTGNDQFEGYCVDLAHLLASMLNFTYEFRLVKDNRFGSKGDNGEWNGMIGELVRNEADIAIATLTVTSSREQVVDFSKPFMDAGVSIMLKKPKIEPFARKFLKPFSWKVYIYALLAYIGFSVVLFLIVRFSPYEDSSRNDADKQSTKHYFTLFNTLWFAWSTLMMRNVNQISLKSPSARIATSAWWLFSLILICCYIAILIPFLISPQKRYVLPIGSIEDLAQQSEIEFGLVANGSTYHFFKNSKLTTFKRLWTIMNQRGFKGFVKSNKEGIQRVRESNGRFAFILESSVNEYLNTRYPCDTIKVGNDFMSKSYGIATPPGSNLKDGINLAILKLREEGILDDLKAKWWTARTECVDQPTQSLQFKALLSDQIEMSNIVSIFYVLIGGIIVSIVMVFFEIIYSSYSQSRRNQETFSDAFKSKIRFGVSGYKRDQNNRQDALTLKNDEL